MNGKATVFAVDSNNFDEAVVQQSHQRVVVVDFWAEWCAPCKQIGPVLEELAESYDGRLAVAKLDVDRNRELAVQYNVRGIPAVKIFRNGSIVREFTGALPRPEVQRIIESVLPTAADELVEEGDRLLQRAEPEAAVGRFRRALKQDEHHAGALLRLGQVALEKGDTEEAMDLLSRIEQDAPEYESAQGALARIEFAEICRQAGGLDACRRRARQTDDGEAHHNLACCLAAHGDYEGALAEFLYVLQAEREYRGQAAQKAMLRIFGLVGTRSEVAQKYRRKLAAALY